VAQQDAGEFKFERLDQGTMQATRMRAFLPVNPDCNYGFGVRCRTSQRAESNEPQPASKEIGRPLTETEEQTLVEVEGLVTFVSQRGGDLFFELSSETAALQVKVPGVSPADTIPLLNCRARVRGQAGRLLDEQGRWVLGTVLASGLDSVFVEQVPKLSGRRRQLYRGTPPSRPALFSPPMRCAGAWKNSRSDKRNTNPRRRRRRNH